MKTITLRPRRSLLVPLALVGATASVLGIQTAQAQDDLHPDWSRVWNQDDQHGEPGTMTVPANVVVPVTLDNSLSSATARLGDIVTATIISHQDGDSEFPPGTHFGGVVSQVQCADKSMPGVLDVDFQSALLPDGTEVPLHGFIASLDSDAVNTRDGHLIARDGSHVNAWKAIGVGGATGFVLGRLLKTNGALPTILGAAGGYLYARSKSHTGEEANINAGTAFGIRLESPVDFPDPDNYAGARLSYLETHRDYSPAAYGWNEAIAAPPRYRYDYYDVVPTCPSWVVVSPYDYYNCPIVPIFVPYRHDYHRAPCWDARVSFWDRPDFHRGARHDTWNNGPRYGGSRNSGWNNRPNPVGALNPVGGGNRPSWRDHSSSPDNRTVPWNNGGTAIGSNRGGDNRNWGSRPGTEPRSNSTWNNVPSTTGTSRGPSTPSTIGSDSNGGRGSRERGDHNRGDSPGTATSTARSGGFSAPSSRPSSSGGRGSSEGGSRGSSRSGGGGGRSGSASAGSTGRSNRR